MAVTGAGAEKVTLETIPLGNFSVHLQLWHLEVLQTMLLQLSSQSTIIEPPTN